MPEYSNTRFTGYADVTTAASTPTEIPIKLMGDSTAHTMVEGEGLSIQWFRAYTHQPSGVNKVYLSYDADGSTEHITIAVSEESSGWSPMESVYGEEHTTYPAPAGKTWKIWALGMAASDNFHVHIGGTITNKQ